MSDQESSADGPFENNEEKQEIRTLFVSGLPQDVRYREVYNFFRFFLKFEHCVLNLKGRSPVAWISFQTPEDAINAQRATNLLKFDPDNIENNLKVELAKHNSLLKKRTRQEIQKEQETQKRYRNEQAQSGPPQVFGQYPPPTQSYPPVGPPGSPGIPPPGVVPGSPPGQYPPGPQFRVKVPGGRPFATPPPQQQMYGVGLDQQQQPWYGPSPDRMNMNMSNPLYPGVPMPRPQPVTNPIAYAQAYSVFHSHVSTPVSTGGNAPCTTLFVANIHRDTTEDEIRESFQGCSRLRFNPPRESGGPICFVEYDSIATATAVREIMNGFRFKNDYGKGIKIEYAKNPMGTRSSKNASSQQSNSSASGANTYGPVAYPKQGRRM